MEQEVGNGLSNVRFFLGVVEDNADPMRLGRCRVRCFGVHTDDPTELPTEDLPWAMPVLTSPQFSIPPRGGWAFGLFLDGQDAQHPILLGSIASMPTTMPDMSYGSQMRACEIYQPQMSRLQRVEDLVNSNLTVKAVGAAKDVKTANGSTWSQPPSGYAAEYPHNTVHETRSGHSIELDDTPNNERISIYHTSGSFDETDAYGTKVTKVVGDGYQIYDRNGYVYVAGARSVTVSGQSEVYVQGDAVVRVDGNMLTSVGGNWTLDVGGRIELNQGEGIELKGSSISIETTTGDLSLKSGRDVMVGGQKVSLNGEVAVGGETSFTGGVIVAGDLQVEGDDVKIKADGDYFVQADTIKTKASHVRTDTSDESDTSLPDVDVDDPTEPSAPVSARLNPATARMVAVTRPPRPPLRPLGIDDVDDVEA